MLTRRSAIAAGLTLCPALGFWRAAVAAAPPPLSEGRFRLPDGRCLGFADYGDPIGVPVFYFHGTPGSRIEAGLIADEAAAAGVRLVAIERPGIGLSDYQPCRRILDWPADVAAVAIALGYGESQFGVLGLSGGAPYALACIRCMPERIAHAAIVSGHTPLNVPGAPSGEEDRLIAFVGRRPRLARMAFNVEIWRLRRRPDRVLEKIAGHWTDSDRRLVLCDPLYREAAIDALREATRCGPAGIVTDVTLLSGDWGFRLGELAPASVSFWQGGCDPIAPVSMGRYFHRHVAGSELFIDPCAGHLTMLKWHVAEILAQFT